ncbi:MAG: pyruvate dehydrogenase (acetyl-transferring) E1 component subunit alpha [Gammaproteobacteria bacterium]|nr:pyruvate dehydrogenase (acetyl-transferring) E1 component subunit alpha [Gammaproteobacteria bacterium]
MPTHESPSIRLKTIAGFSIQYLQFMDHHGNLTQAIPNDITPETLLKLYRAMTLTRLFDTKAINLQRTGQMGTYPSCHGQEAIGAAIGLMMRKEDVFYPYYRDHATFLLRGTPMSDILTYWGGDERGSAFESQPDNQDFPICVPIADQCLHAAGGAFAFQYRNQKRVAVTTIGEGGTSQGDFYEAINLAGAWQLPVVFVVNNNQWAISTPIHAQTACKAIAQKAIAAGFEGIQVDGNDVIAMIHSMKYALDKAREGKGPTLIEAITYRICDHTTADDAKRYIPPKEFDAAFAFEPLKRLRAYLEKELGWDDTQEQAMLKELNDELQAIVKQFLERPKAAITDMFDYLYETLPEQFISQREELTAWNNIND